MASNIDTTKPEQGSPTTASVRLNFTAAKNEIEALQTSLANKADANHVHSSTVSYQSSATYSIVAGDNGYNLIYNGSSAGAWTIPSGITLGASFGVYVENRSATKRPLRITPASGTINGKATLSIPYGAGAFINSDGTSLLVATYSIGLGGRLAVARLSVPMLIPPNGSVDATGGVNATITLGTSIVETLQDGCYIYLPAGGAFAGSLAGFYYAVMSSATVGIIYNNRWTASDDVMPSIPSSPTPITSGRGPTAYTTPLDTQIVVSRVTVPGNLLGDTGRLQCHCMMTASNTARGKQIIADLGGYPFYQNSPQNQSFASVNFGFSNVGRVDRQKSLQVDSSSGFGQGVGSIVRGSVNTANDLTLELRGALISGGAGVDFQIFQSYLAEVVL